MKKHHHKTLWIHTFFSFSVCIILALIALLKGDLPTIAIGAAIALYVFGNTIIHIKRDDFNQQTVVEYVLIGVAVFVILVGTFR